MKVKLKNKHTLKNCALLLDKTYEVLGIECDDYRIVDENGDPYLFPFDSFEIIDRSEPDDWITEIGDDGERYSYPIELNQPGFFEDFFEGKEEVKNQFNKFLKKRFK